MFMMLSCMFDNGTNLFCNGVDVVLCCFGMSNLADAQSCSKSECCVDDGWRWRVRTIIPRCAIRGWCSCVGERSDQGREGLPVSDLSGGDPERWKSREEQLSLMNIVRARLFWFC